MKYHYPKLTKERKHNSLIIFRPKHKLDRDTIEAFQKAYAGINYNAIIVDKDIDIALINMNAIIHTID